MPAPRNSLHPQPASPCSCLPPNSIQGSRASQTVNGTQFARFGRRCIVTSCYGEDFNVVSLYGSVWAVHHLISDVQPQPSTSLPPLSTFPHSAASDEVLLIPAAISLIQRRFIEPAVSLPLPPAVAWAGAE